MTRDALITHFLTSAGWGDAERHAMAADFSTRRYTRLKRGDATAILMDADPDQKTGEFVRIAHWLRQRDFSAPEIIAEQADQGLVLLEDFGTGAIGGLIDKGASPLPFARRAADFLAALHRHQTVEDRRQLGALPHFTAELFTAQVEKFLDGYMPHALQRGATDGERADFRAIWLKILRPLDSLPQALLLRDFMPDNVMDLPQREGLRSLGLLDFQDAGWGPIVYDIASFCETVRRDGGDACLQPMLTHYYQMAKPAADIETLDTACQILSAQRHMRILGILASSTKQHFLPRVEARVKYFLQHRALTPLRRWMEIAGF